MGSSCAGCKVIFMQRMTQSVDPGENDPTSCLHRERLHLHSADSRAQPAQPVWDSNCDSSICIMAPTIRRNNLKIP